MSTITTDDVRRLAILSNLALTDEEVPALRKDIEEILKYVAQLSDIDTEGVEPTYQVTGLEDITRPDEVTNSGVSREQLIALAADSALHQVKVPKVL